MNRTFLSNAGEHWRTLPRRGRLFAVVVVIVIVLLIIRLALPSIVRHVINERLAAIDPYHGHVDDVDLALWRGAYTISGVTLAIRHHDAADYERLLKIESIDIGLYWGALFRGRIVGNITLTRPELFLTPRVGRHGVEPPPADDETPAPPTEEAPERWQDQLRHLSVLRFDRIVIENGVLHYADDAHDVAPIQLAVFQARINDLSLGAQADGQEATLKATGETIGSGVLSIHADVDPLATQPTFSVRAALEAVACPALNPLTKRFDDLQFDSGTFSCYIEVAAADGRIEGFLKPIFIDLDVASYKDKSGSAASRLFWGALIPVAEFLLENAEENQHAARIPIEGDIEDPDTNVWDVVVSAVRNAFIQAIIPGFDPGH